MCNIPAAILAIASAKQFVPAPPAYISRRQARRQEKIRRAALEYGMPMPRHLHRELAPGFKYVNFLPGEFGEYLHPKTIAEPFPLDEQITFHDGTPVASVYRATHSVNIDADAHYRVFGCRVGSELFIFARMEDKFSVFMARTMAQYEPGIVISTEGEPIKALYLLGGVK